MAIFLPQRWRQQPQGAAKVDWSNPLSKGIIHAGTPNHNISDGVDGLSWKDSSTPPVAVGRAGLFWASSPYSSYSVTSPNLYEDVDQTVLWIVSAEYDSYTGAFPPVKGPSGGDNSGTGIGIAPSGNIVYFGGYQSILINSGVAIPLKSINTIVFTSKTSESAIYLNGNLIASTATRYGFADGYYNTYNRLGYLGDYGNYVTVQGRTAYPVFTYGVAQWANRSLSFSEAKELSANPWQIFRPITSTKKYFIPSARQINTTTHVGTFLPQRWRQQPQGPVQVDWSHPLAKNLLYAFNAGSMTGHHTKQTVSIPGPTSIASNSRVLSSTFSEYGTGLTYFIQANPGLGVTSITEVPDGYTGGLTLFCHAHYSAINTNTASLLRWRTVYNVNRNNFAIQADQYHLLAYIDNAAQIIQGGFAFPVGKMTAAITYEPSSFFRLYNTGLLVGSLDTSGWAISSPFMSEASQLYLGDFSGTNAFNLANALVWRRALSSAEISSLNENPWQIFKPRQSKLYSLTYSYRELTRPRSSLLNTKINAVAAQNIDCRLGTYFAKTVDSNTTFTVSNVPSSGLYKFVLKLTTNSGTITWWNGIEWASGISPTLTSGKTHMLIFETKNGGTAWRGSYITDYAS